MGKMIKLDIKSRYVVSLVFLIALIEIALQLTNGYPLAKFIAFVAVMGFGQHFLVRMIYSPVEHLIRQLKNINYEEAKDSLTQIDSRAFDRFDVVATEINTILCKYYYSSSLRAIEFLDVATNFFIAKVTRNISDIILKNNIHTEQDKEASYESMINEYRSNREEVYLRSQLVVSNWIKEISHEVDTALEVKLFESFSSIVHDNITSDQKIRLLNTSLKLFISDYSSLIRFKIEEKIKEEITCAKRTV